MSRYVDLVRKEDASAKTQQPQGPTREDYLRNAAESEARLERLKEEIRNPLSLKISESVSKKFGDIAGGIVGGVARTIERPIRSLAGGVYGAGTGIKAAFGDKDAQKRFATNQNPFMTSEDMAAMKSNDISAPIKYGGKIAADVIPWIIPGGTSLKMRAGLGALSGAAGTYAEDKPTLRSVVTNAVIGSAVGTGTGLLGKGFNKLRSKPTNPNLRSGGSTPQINAPEQYKMLPQGNVPEEKITSLAPQNQSLKKIDTDIEVKDPAIEGEIIDETGIIKSNKTNGKKITIDSYEPIKYKAGGLKSYLTGFKEELKKYGDTGKKISGLMDTFENRYTVKSATSINKFKKSLNKLKGKETPEDNEKIINYILDLYNGKKLPANVLTKEQREVAESFFRDVTLEPSVLAKKLGLKAGGKNLGKPRPFIPLIPKDIKKFKEAHLARLMGKGMSEADATKTINDIMDEMYNPKHDLNARRFAGFENERFFEPQSYKDLVDYGYVDNLFDIADKWSDKAWKRIEAIQTFGGKNYEGVNKVLDDLKKQGVAGKDIEYLKKSIATFLHGRELGTEASEQLAGTLKDISRFKLSPTSGIKQMTSLSQTASIAGPVRTLKNMVKLATKKFTEKDKNIVDNAGLILNDRYDAVTFGTSRMDNSIGVIKKLADVNFKITGIRPLDAGIRKISGYSGLEWIRNSVDDIVSGKLTGKAKDARVKELLEFAFPSERELGRVLETGSLTDEQLSMAVHNFVKKTQFGVSRAELPASWSNSAVGEVASALRSYGFEQVQFVGRLFNLAKTTGNVKPLATYLTTYLGLAGLADIMTNIVMKGGHKDKDFSELLEDVDKKGLFAQAIFGLYYDAFRYSGFATGAAGLVGGPAAGELVDVMNTASTTAENLETGKDQPFKELGQFVGKRTVAKIPIIGPEIMEKLNERRKSSSSGKKTLQ